MVFWSNARIEQLRILFMYFTWTRLCYIKCEITDKTFMFTSYPPPHVYWPRVYFIYYTAPSIRKCKVHIAGDGISTFTVWGHGIILKWKSKIKNKQASKQAKKQCQLEQPDYHLGFLINCSSVPWPLSGTNRYVDWISNREVEFGKELKQIMLQSW